MGRCSIVIGFFIRRLTKKSNSMFITRLFVSVVRSYCFEFRLDTIIKEEEEEEERPSLSQFEHSF